MMCCGNRDYARIVIKNKVSKVSLFRKFLRRFNWYFIASWIGMFVLAFACWSIIIKAISYFARVDPLAGVMITTVAILVVLAAVFSRR